MKILFIQKDEKSNKLKERLNTIKLQENKVLISTNLEKTKIKIKQKIVAKIKKIMKQEKVDKIVLSKEMKEDKEFINLLYSNNIKMSDNKWLFKKCINQIIDEVMNNQKKQDSEICITVNELDDFSQNIILKNSKEFKRVKIITNHIGKFAKIEEKLYNDEGIAIIVTNNKRKSLLNSKLILNIDFPKELINQFAIYDKATIISIEEKISIKKKRFNGKIIDNIEITNFEDEELLKYIDQNKLEKYDINDICESLSCIPDSLSFELK